MIILGGERVDYIGLQFSLSPPESLIIMNNDNAFCLAVFILFKKQLFFCIIVRFEMQSLEKE